MTQVQAFQSGGEQSIQVFFSDSLDPRQNLRGLVRLGAGGSTQRIEGSVLRIYPESGLEGDAVLTLEAGIRNARGERTRSASQHSVAFAAAKPQVRFVGKGVILPGDKVLSVPFEALNVRSVRVTALRVYESNVGQFLQVNKLDGQRELSRVGRYLWRKTIHLPQGDSGRWNRYALDVTELAEKNPGGLFRLTISITRADSRYACPDGQGEAAPMEPPPANAHDLSEREASSWDYAEQYFGADGREKWHEREDPCKSAYYRFAAGTRDARNFLASNLGLLAKRDPRGRLLAAATDLRTAQPLRGVKITAMNFQNQPLASESTDGEGLASFGLSATPFYLLAEKDGHKGYLKLAPGTSLPVSHFDVGGEKVAAGLKGYLYGERGVWRPGDDIFLTFVLQDADKTLPPGHPVTLELRNPQGQLVQTLTNAAPVGSFYKFALKTAADAPTGDWTARAILGGASFSRAVKIEAVMPNRLKIELDVGEGKLSGGAPLSGRLSAQWLTGASAAGLRADVKMRLVKTATRFERFADFGFDDPAREFAAEPEAVFDGELDASGEASFEHGARPSREAPGMLIAALTTRVFEPGGAFSISRQTAPFSPYDRYVGIKLPKGDAARSMLLTDTQHTVQIASVSAAGKPQAARAIEVTLYKVEWKWWWDKSGESLAQYAAASHSSVVKRDTVSTDADGQGTWNFAINYPQWGRYLVRACDTDGGHCSGQTFYIDWPAWAGRAQEQAGPGASVLTFNADKEQYTVGEKALIQLPEASQGRALVTLENGSGILQARWLELEKGRTRFEVPITRAMLRQHGVQRFYDFLGALGMTTLRRRPEEYGLTLILGGAEATLHDVAGMYANLAHIARRISPGPPAHYRRLKVLVNEESAERNAAEISAGAAWLTMRALLEVARPAEEAYWRSFASSRRIAWKTGTSWGLRDAWAVGNTTRHTVAVWAGNATGEGRPGLTGASAAAPILFDLFNRLDPADWFAPPSLHLKEVEVCSNDGYLANGNCETERQWAPRDSQFDQPSPHNLRVHLDAARSYRVHGECERVAAMTHADWFVLPPAQEFFYRRHHADYRVLAPYRADCEAGVATRGTRGPIDFLYPGAGAKIYIPIDLAETRSRVVFEAVHRDREATLHWHLDDAYIGTTHTFHQRALDAPAGAHTITVVDLHGNRLSRQFEVLAREQQ